MYKRSPSLEGIIEGLEGLRVHRALGELPFFEKSRRPARLITDSL